MRGKILILENEEELLQAHTLELPTKPKPVFKSTEFLFKITDVDHCYRDLTGNIHLNIFGKDACLEYDQDLWCLLCKYFEIIS